MLMASLFPVTIPCLLALLIEGRLVRRRDTSLIGCSKYFYFVLQFILCVLKNNFNIFSVKELIFIFYAVFVGLQLH
jgi:hypothetical protein